MDNLTEQQTSHKLMLLECRLLYIAEDLGNMLGKMAIEKPSIFGTFMATFCERMIETEKGCRKKNTARYLEALIEAFESMGFEHLSESEKNRLKTEVVYMLTKQSGD